MARYAEIQRALETAIFSGDWPPGARVPSEQELLKQYRCSRMTVNKALSALAASGLIVRRRRSGSFVATPEAEKNVLQISDTEDEVVREGKSYRMELLSSKVRKSTAQDSAHLGVPVGTRVLALTCAHFADDRPILFEHRLINLVAVPSAEKVDFSGQSPGNWLLAKVPWSEAEHHIRARNASAEVAAALDIKKGDACLVVERRTQHVSQFITHVMLFYPGQSYHLVARFNPSGG
ncbi:histidine utilization repressor [Bradyrhizobium sp. Ash2021]|uniref:histidine utilization repressor n=1 Tax=Bradyrhizobium sp. Ash2021 TaxID=2954771 RepID=UPI0028151EA0|nr:histidine utilization repressor [Bradyrhizobium sp. Ash2021]WMT75970.1 histidine utilization repressor [Bradyrhizobium sp. Ash2021]